MGRMLTITSNPWTDVLRMAMNYKEISFKPVPSSTTAMPLFQDLYIKCDDPPAVLEYLDERHPYLPIFPETIEQRVMARYLINNLYAAQNRTVEAILQYTANHAIKPNPRRPTCVDFCIAAMIPQLYTAAWRTIRCEYL